MASIVSSIMSAIRSKDDSFHETQLDDTFVDVPVMFYEKTTLSNMPSTWSTIDNACNFCYGSRCNICPETSFRSVVDELSLSEGTPLITGLPGWHCCSCDACASQLSEARAKHVVPKSILDRVFEKRVKISDAEVESTADPTWQILCAFRTNWSGTSGHTVTAVVWRRLPGQQRPQRLVTSLEMIVKCNPSDDVEKFVLLKHWV